MVGVNGEFVGESGQFLGLLHEVDEGLGVGSVGVGVFQAGEDEKQGSPDNP
jgi:hypothetical protein